MSEHTVSVTIAGLSFRLKAVLSEEELIQQTASLINEHISEFEKKYPVKEKRDVLAMVCLELTSDLLKKQQTLNSEISHLKAVLDDLNALVESHKQKVQG